MARTKRTKRKFDNEGEPLKTIDAAVVSVGTSIVGRFDSEEQAPLHSGVMKELAKMQAQVWALTQQNAVLHRQVAHVTSVGAADKFQIIQVRKMVKEDLFKKVKFITTAATEAACMQYLATKFSVRTEDQRDWTVTYSHYVRDALNNKRNNVAQDLKRELNGTYQMLERAHTTMEQHVLTHCHNSRPTQTRPDM